MICTQKTPILYPKPNNRYVLNELIIFIYFLYFIYPFFLRILNLI